MKTKSFTDFDTTSVCCSVRVLPKAKLDVYISYPSESKTPQVMVEKFQNRLPPKGKFEAVSQGKLRMSFCF